MTWKHEARPSTEPDGFDEKALEIFRLAVGSRSELERYEWTKHWDHCTNQRHNGHKPPREAELEAYTRVLEILFSSIDWRNEIKRAGTSDALEYAN